MIKTLFKKINNYKHIFCPNGLRLDGSMATQPMGDEWVVKQFFNEKILWQNAIRHKPRAKSIIR